MFYVVSYLGIFGKIADLLLFINFFYDNTSHCDIILSIMNESNTYVDILLILIQLSKFISIAGEIKIMEQKNQHVRKYLFTVNAVIFIAALLSTASLLLTSMIMSENCANRLTCQCNTPQI